MWNSTTKKLFRKALTDVYRDYSQLQVFVMDELSLQLPQIIYGQSLDVIVFNLSTGTKVVEPVENQCDEGRNRDRDGEENPSPSETSSSRVAHET
jgi:hypothetical protein